MKVYDFLPEFFKALKEQLKSDDLRWGDTWLRRGREGQEARTRATYNDYFDQFEATGKPINWLAVVGGALICWIREQHPELWKGTE